MRDEHKHQAKAAYNAAMDKLYREYITLMLRLGVQRLTLYEL